MKKMEMLSLRGGRRPTKQSQGEIASPVGLAMTILGVFFIFSVSSCATVESVFDSGMIREKTFKADSGLKIDYTLLSFKPSSADERFPLLLALHGTAGSGTDEIWNWKEEATKHRMMILAPTTDRPFKNSKQDLDLIDSLVEEIVQKNPVDKNRIYLAGTSAGGLLARWLLMHHPSRWRAVVFISYASVEDWRSPSKLPPILFVHGAEDTQFPSEQVKENVDALKQKGIAVDWIEDSTAGHEHREEWNGKIIQWLEKQ